MKRLIKDGDLLVIKIPSDDGVTNEFMEKSVLYKEDYHSGEIVLVDLQHDWFYVSKTLEIALTMLEAEIVESIPENQIRVIRI